jgi:UDP-N-acetyl-D-galactosamine dehydrogenase
MKRKPMNTSLKNLRIGVIGFGYIGLPLAVEFDEKHPALDFDIN